VSRWEGGGLIVLALAYTAWMVHAARTAATVAHVTAHAATAGEAADAAGAPKPGGTLRALAIAAAGLAILLVGGSLFVDGSVSVARALGMSDRLVGLTVVAIGTSLPELVTSVIAARRGHSDLAIGNVVGSNIFNVLLCLGAFTFERSLEWVVNDGLMVIFFFVVGMEIRREVPGTPHRRHRAP